MWRSPQQLPPLRWAPWRSGWLGEEPHAHLMDSGCDRVMATEPLCRRCPATCSLSSGPWLPCCSVAWALRAAADPEWALLSSLPGGPRCRARARVRHMRKGQATWAEGVTAASQKAQRASCSQDRLPEEEEELGEVAACLLMSHFLLTHCRPCPGLLELTEPPQAWGHLLGHAPCPALPRWACLS